MFSFIHDFLIYRGLTDKQAEMAMTGIKIAIVILTIMLTNVVTRRYLLAPLTSFVKKSKTHWDNILLKHKVFNRLSNLSPALVVYLFAPTFGPYVAQSLQKVALVSMILIAVLVVDRFLSALVDIYRSYEVSRHKPIKGYVQVTKIALYVLGALFILATLMDKDPWGLLVGLGALTAVIMLVFKDSIIGLVSSVQLTSNNMVRIGDWIEMPKYGADGDVIDVSLHTVKVQNWDKTVSSVPTYALMTDSFKNWRGMEESGGRRIKRSMYIDINSIKFCTEEMLERFKKVHYIADYVAQKFDEIYKFNVENEVDESLLINGRHLTNIGTFRAYVCAYLRQHPKIRNDMTFIVRHMPPSEYGLPIEIYVFSSDQVWANYEAIQADIFDHILAVLPEFDLRVYQSPSGHDIQTGLAALGGVRD